MTEQQAERLIELVADILDVLKWLVVVIVGISLGTLLGLVL